MRTLDEITVFVPEFSAGQEWQDAEAEVEPAEIPILRVQRLLAGLLKEVRPPDDHPVPLLLGWLLLWTRIFQGLEGLRGAVVRRSLYAARILSRALLETNVHLRAISRQLSDLQSSSPLPVRVKSTVDRLHAYVAWAVYSDMQEWVNFLRPENLSAIYDPAPAREYVRQYGNLIATAGPLLNDVETLTDAEASAERKEAEGVARKRIAEYEEWLADERLASYAERLRKKRYYSFIGFLDPGEKSVRGALDADGVPYAYGAYARGSAVVHGTTLEGILKRGGASFSPQIWSTDDDIASAISHGLDDARNATLGLYILRPSYLGTAGT